MAGQQGSATCVAIVCRRRHPVYFFSSCGCPDAIFRRGRLVAAFFSCGRPDAIFCRGRLVASFFSCVCLVACPATSSPPPAMACGNRGASSRRAAA
jgi:hypothetical protein